MTAREEAGLEGAWAVVSRSLQGEAGACGGDHGRIRTALSRRCAHATKAGAHATGAGAYRALLEVVVENVDAVVVVVEGGPAGR